MVSFDDPERVTSTTGMDSTEVAFAKLKKAFLRIPGCSIEAIEPLSLS